MTHKPPRTKATSKALTTDNKRAQPPRLRPALRKALDEIALKGRTQRDAANIAGMNETSLGRALRKPAVAEYLESLKAAAIIDATNLRGLAKAMAIQTGIELMRDAKSEAVKARMVEFFAGDGRSGTQVNVAVNVDRGGYEFVRPDQRIVDIRPSLDHASSADEGQVIDLAGDNGEVDE